MKQKISTLQLGQRFGFFEGGTVYQIILKDTIDMRVRGYDPSTDQYIGDPFNIDFTERGNPAHLPVFIK
jgi:hypothetical protein